MDMESVSLTVTGKPSESLSYLNQPNFVGNVLRQVNHFYSDMKVDIDNLSETLMNYELSIETDKQHFGLFENHS